MAATLELRADLLRSLDFGSIVAGYTAVGTALDRPMRLLNVQNTTNALLMFSFDGINDHFTVPTNSFLLLDVCTNDIGSIGFFISRGTRIHVKRIGIPSSGTVYISTFFARGS